MNDPTRAYEALCDRLFAGPRRQAPGARTGGAQIYDGTAGIRTVPGGVVIADGYCRVVGAVDVEEWVIFNENDFLNATTEWFFVGATPDKLDATRLGQLETMQNGGQAIRYTKFSFVYKSMPTAADVAALPATNPPGVVTYAYKVDGPLPAGGVGRTAELFRERKQLPNGFFQHVDHWVYLPAYTEPQGADVNKVVPDTSPTRSTTLKSFLDRLVTEQGLSANPGAWKYSQVRYNLGPLPTYLG